MAILELLGTWKAGCAAVIRFPNSSSVVKKTDAKSNGEAFLTQAYREDQIYVEGLWHKAASFLAACHPVAWYVLTGQCSHCASLWWPYVLGGDMLPGKAIELTQLLSACE